MLYTIRELLAQIIDDIDAGNSNITDEESLKIASILREVVRTDEPMSKYQAYTYLGMSRAKFDNLVRQGKIPKGKKVQGFNELRWYKKDLKDLGNL